MLKIRVLNQIKIWRFLFLYNYRYFSIWWLTDYKYFSNLHKYDYGTEKPIIKLGDTWKKKD